MLNSPETELAFTLSNGRAHVESHSIFDGVKSTSQQLVSTYFDTPARTLERAGWTVRIRVQGERRTQTVKGPTVAATRGEMNTELDPAGQYLDIDKLASTPIWPMIANHPTALRPLFESDIIRVTRDVRVENTRIETAIDEGVIRCFYNGAHCVGVNDLELEIKDGDAGAMYRLAIELVLDTGIVMQPASKAERGYQLVNGGAPQLRKHGDVALHKGMPTIMAFRYLLSEILTHIRQNWQVAHAGVPGGIHQIRVGIRRLRAMFVLFEAILDQPTVKVFDDELRYFGTVFGQARDWDVFVTETLPAATNALPNAGWLHLLAHVAGDKQTEAHVNVVREIEGSRFNSLILSLMGWAEDFPTHNAPRRVYDRAIEKVMPDLLSSVAAQVTKRRKRLDDTPERLHSFRKAVKKMRYAVEFSESLYPGRAVKKFLAPHKRAQEALGGLNDVAVTRQLVETLTVSYPAVMPAVRELSVWLDQCEQSAARPVSKLLHKLHTDKLFWEA